MSKVAKATIGLMMITMLSKVLGFIRETILVAIHGPGLIADAYITSMNIPNVIFATIGTALATTFIPLFFEVREDKGEKAALNFSSNVFNIVIVLSIILSIIGFVFAEPITKIFAINFYGEKLILATKFTRIMIFGMVFIGLSNIMTCWLQINGNFIIPGMTGIPYNTIIIISILLSSNGNLNIMAIGTLVATVSYFIFQYPFAYKNKFRYKPHISLNDAYIKKMIYLIIPVFIGVGVNQLNTVVDRSLASTLGDGVITILNSANRLNSFVLGLFISTIVSVIYPMLSKLSSKGNDDEFKDTIRKSLNIILILIIPISIGAIVLAEPVVRIVFERGKFDFNATILTASALRGYSIGMIGSSLREILNRVFYSLKDTKTPMINGALSMAINIVLNIIFIKLWGHIGLALATSTSVIICTILMLVSLKNKVGYFGQDKILKTLIKSFVSAIIMGIMTHFVYEYLSIVLSTDIIALFVAITVGVLVYSIMIAVFRIEEVYSFFYIFKRKFKLDRNCNI